jgi:translation initiation factor 2B subunit (eIF-2B alpha/beta/delta family)
VIDGLRALAEIVTSASCINHCRLIGISARDVAEHREELREIVSQIVDERLEWVEDIAEQSSELADHGAFMETVLGLACAPMVVAGEKAAHILKERIEQ